MKEGITKINGRDESHILIYKLILNNNSLHLFTIYPSIPSNFRGEGAIFELCGIPT
jgi:hypothetical protein